MTDVTIFPLYDQAAFNMQITVDSVDLYLSFYWNERTEHYHITATTLDGSVLMDGQKVVVASPIFTSAMFSAGLRGYFIIYSRTDQIEDNATTRKNWASNYILSYVS